MKPLRSVGQALAAFVSPLRLTPLGPSELPEDWPQAFDEDERDYLYEESQRRLREVLEFGDQQEAKALALARIALIVIAASGIFGDLQIESASPQEWGPTTIASIVAIAASIVVGAITFWLLHPPEWQTGANVEWLARWSGARKRDMKDAVLEVLVEGFWRNTEITRVRGERLVWLLWAVAFQTICVVAVQVVSALD